jgi:type IV pilus assembly protein PilC
MAEKLNNRKEMNPAELSLFFANLELIYHSGLTPAEGFDILRQNSLKNMDDDWLGDLYKYSVDGLPLSEALVRTGGIPDYALSLLRIGEETGKLEDTCKSLRGYYEKRDELMRAVRSALVYPLTMVAMVFVVVIVLLVEAMPVFDQVFNQLGFELTGLASTLLSVGQVLRSSALYIIIAIAVLVVLVFLLRLTPFGKRLFNTMYEHAPITGAISTKLSLQRFALAMATTLNSGLDADEALALAEPLIENHEVERKVRRILDGIQSSKVSFHTAISESKLFPPAEMSLLIMGFQAGASAQVFDQVGASLAASTERRLERLVGGLEPALVGFMCIVVGIVLLSVMLPLLGVLSSI